MKLQSLFLPTLLFLGALAHGETVAVGSSDLIGTLQYSDTFSFGSGTSGTRNGVAYTAKTNLSGMTDQVQDAYGNTTKSYSGTAFSLGNDSDYFNSTSYSYPGPSGSGSSTDGFAEIPTTNSATAIGFSYAVSGNFIIQLDAVQTNDRIDISIGSSVGISTGLSIFFRATDNGAYPSIGIYNGHTETNTGISNDVVSAGAWENYAVDFNLNNDTLTFFANETDLGTINLKTFDGGAYLSGLSGDSYISVGGATLASDKGTAGDYIYIDDLQIGAAPEPGTWGMLMGGLTLLAGIVRLRRLSA